MNTVHIMLLTTHYGAEHLAKAAMLGSKVQLIQLTLGKGEDPSLNPEQTQLKNEISRIPLKRIMLDPNNPYRVLCEATLEKPSYSGNICEVGLVDADSKLVAIGHLRNTWERGEETQTIHAVLTVNDTTEALCVTASDGGMVVPPVSAATEQEAGIVQLATQSEAKAGLAENKALTPAAGTVYLQKDNNLADLANKTTALSHLGLGSAAVKNAGTGDTDLITTDDADSRYLKNSENLANNTTARTKLGLGTAALKDAGTGNTDLITTGDADSRYLNATQNLNDLTDKAAALINLGLENVLIDRKQTLSDWDTALKTGIYFDWHENKNKANPSGFPPGNVPRTGTLVVLNTGLFINQLYMAEAEDRDVLWYRTKFGALRWTPWQKIVTDKNYIGLFKSFIDDETKRKELGLGSAAVKNVGTGNADLITTGEADSRYLNISKNFSDITDKPAALANLGLQDAATHEYVKTQLATHASSNVSAATEQQAGLVQLATLDEAKAGLAENKALTPAAGAAYLQKDNNLADLANKEKARRYLGLGTAALRDVGILDNQVVTSNQLKDLFTKSFQAGANGYQIFPSGLMMQWGSAKQTASGNVTVIWPNPFPTAVLSVVATPIKSSTLSLSYAVVEITERMAIFCPMIISQTFKIGRVYPVVGSETFSSSSHSVNDEILNSSSYNFNGETFETFNSRHLRSFDSEDSSLDDSFFWQAIGY
ncbi:phage tail protein [Candidatus Regiella insecticola]|uniref:Phage tail-collar fibre protein n=1 Tax=Candidatus Regiella insecticola TaxID=138073 RepID=A0A6L2ZSM3_9ENTR|nr:phage tail protein [Candidatus Regiella insecticola]GFN47415.1 phage tail-collar fibre protein [Candidatus Regiella insecticola]